MSEHRRKKRKISQEYQNNIKEIDHGIQTFRSYWC